MARAVRAVTVEQGVDPRDLALVAFGGAGPLHACAVADELGMRAVIVPPRAGVFSALGLLCAPEQRELVESWPTPSSRAGLDEARAAARGAGRPSSCRAVDVDEWLDCRYAGQSHELTVADVDEFPAVHERRNGYARPGVDVEVVALAGAGLARRAARGHRSPRTRAARRVAGPRSSPSPTARSGCPTAGRPTPGAGAAAWIRRSASRVNPAELQILGSRLASVADEMGAVLRRAAFSPNIKERADCSAALFTADGELLAQAEHIPVHLGSMPASVRGRDRHAATRRTELMLNDPFAGGTHLNDITMVAPVLRRRACSSGGSPTARTTPTSVAPPRARCRPTR